MTTPSPDAPGGVVARAPADIRRAAFLALMAGLIASAWLILWLWSASPYARYLDHGRWTDTGMLASVCRAVPAGEVVVPALLYAAGWVLMIAAMMLPTTLPILDMFRRITIGRADRSRLLGLVVIGYLTVWLGFGLVAHMLDWLLHVVALRLPWLEINGWAVGVIVLGIAGAFQFSALKYRCLDKCHTPFGFIAERWRGRAPAREALRLGLDHGAFCVGCCWALMMLMFVVGVGSIGWMLALAAVMAMEKNLPGGRRLRTPLGLGLIAWAGGLFLLNVLPAGG
jgi:predicted metal-binding membrane protein